jgi:4-cresol dehydrogenase (hydroxylating)
MSPVLPPGFSEASLRSVLAELARELGDAWVDAPDEPSPDHLDPFALGDPLRFAPSAVVRPGSVEEIQAVLRIANAHRLPLWTVSRGRNLGYGGTAPRVRGSVVLELSRMNRVLEVDEELGYALLEPGVSFFDLYEHLRANGHRLWMSAPGLGWGSVVGNALERGFGQAPYGEHSAAICGLEVVMADGDLVRTGMGSIGDGRAWHVYKGGYGPSLDGLFLQSNYGVVTKMGLWLMPEPESFRACEVTFARDEDFVAMIETLRPLKVGETITGSARAANAVRVAQGTTQRSRWSDDPAPLSRPVIQSMVDELGIGWWNLRFGLFGPDAVVEARYRMVQDAFGRIPGARVMSRRYAGSVTEAEIEPVDRPQAGIPSMMSYAILDWLEGETGHVGFSPLSPLRGEDAVRQVQMVRSRALEHGFDYSAGLTCGTRFLNHIFMILFDPTDDEQTGRARGLFEVLVREGAASGYGEYRTHLEFMDLVAEQYDFHGGSQRRLNETIKDALDPNGILSPGKQGIWPRSADYATTSMPMRSSSVASSGRSTSSTA